MILVIVIFSFLYYMKLVLKGERPFAPFSFLLSLPTDLVYLPYWFLYSYLGVLTILPILYPIYSCSKIFVALQLDECDDP